MRYTCVAALAAALTIGLAAAPVAAQETDAGWVPGADAVGPPGSAGRLGPDHRHPPRAGGGTPAAASS